MGLFAFGVLKQVRHETCLPASGPAIAHSTLCAPGPQPLPLLSRPPLCAAPVVQLVSGVITLVVLGAVAYYFFTRGGDDDDDDGPSSKRSSKQDDDLGDPLSDARRIM